MNYEKLDLSPRERLLFRTAALGTGEIAGWLFYDSLLVGTAVGLALMLTESRYKENLAEKRRNVLLAQFKDLLYSLSSSVSTGRSLGQAMEESVEFWRGTYDDGDYIIKELKYMVKNMKESNLSDIDSLRDFAERSGLKDIKDLVTVCEVCKKTGADFPNALDKSADIIGDKITLERELKTMIAQKKFEGRIVAFAPFGLIFMIKLLSPEYLEPIYAAYAGRLIATVSLTLIAVGFTTIERVNEIEV